MDLTNIIQYLKNNNNSIATMESCTGGLLASYLTDVEGASEVLKFSAVTYSSEYKIKMGVDSSVIDKYTVYSKETAHEMARNISDFAHSDFGVGITGKLSGSDRSVDLSIYDARNNQYYDKHIIIEPMLRHQEKLQVIKEFENLFISTIISK